jgi:ABC-type polysaccharide/polyol phosphate export permease
MESTQAVTRPSRAHAAILDILRGVGGVHIWGLLGWQDIRQRYRRSVIGPFWLTISTGVMILALGLLYARLLGQSVADYLPYLGVGLVVWSFLSTVVNDGCNVFVSVDFIMKQVRLPLTVHAARLVWRNLIIFGHNAVVLLVMMIWLQRPIGWTLLTLPVAVLVITINALWITLLLGVFCTRFRDIPPIIANLVQIAFFMTPILWKPDVLGNRRWIADFNPAYHFLEIVRAPILGAPLPLVSWAVTLVLLPLGFGLTLIVLARFRSRVTYWL